MAEDRDRPLALTKSAVDYRIPQKIGNVLTECSKWKTVRFSERTTPHAVSKALNYGSWKLNCVYEL
jgi:hypothetical protein